MNPAVKVPSPVYRQLEAYEETWKGDHRQVLPGCDGEDVMAVGIALFHMLVEREQAWRD